MPIVLLPVAAALLLSHQKSTLAIDIEEGDTNPNHKHDKNESTNMDNSEYSTLEVGRPRLSTFLSNMETIGYVMTHPMDRFSRNIGLIGHSLVRQTTGSSLREISSRDNLSKSAYDNQSHDGSESTDPLSVDDYYYNNYGNPQEEPDILSCTCHGDEILRRRNTVLTQSAQQQRPSFLESRMEMFAANVDTIAQVVRERGSLGLRPKLDIEEDEEEELSKSTHLTL